MYQKIARISLAWLILCILGGCSVQFEIGYHGKTDRDDRKVTDLTSNRK